MDFMSKLPETRKSYIQTTKASLFLNNCSKNTSPLETGFTISKLFRWLSFIKYRKLLR